MQRDSKRLGDTRPGAPAMAYPMMAATHAAFVLTGTVTTLLGPLLPVLAARWSLDDARAGSLFTAQFAGSMIGVAMSARLVIRWGFTRAVAAGLAAMAAGVGALAVIGWPAGLLAVACYGIGLGITIPAANLHVADAAPERRAAALNILNLAWGIGAVAAPPLFAWLTARGRSNAFLVGLAISLVAIAVLQVASARRRWTQSTARAEPGVERRSFSWTSSSFLVYGALFYVYVGTENAFAGWIAAFARRVDPDALAVSTPAAFWAGLLLGRAAAPLLLRRFRESLLVQSGLLLASTGVALVLAAETLPAIVTGTALSGLGLSVVFPTTMAQLSRRFAGVSATAAAVAFTFAGVGGATVPWLVGVASTAAGDLRAGLTIPLAGCVMMIALHARRAREGV